MGEIMAQSGNSLKIIKTPQNYAQSDNIKHTCF